METWTEEINEVLMTLDKLGVVCSVSAGNAGTEIPSAEYTPNILVARADSPLIIVGAVNCNGQLAKISSIGSAAVPITTYAMGKDIKIVDLSIEEDTLQDGTTFSAAIVVSTLHAFPFPSV